MFHWEGNMNKVIFVAIVLVFSLLLLTGINAQNGTVTGDFNGDGVVNIHDLIYVASNFGENFDPAQEPSPDVNGDGIVNIRDLIIVASMFGDSAFEMSTLIFGRGGDSITLDPSQMLDGESAKVCDMVYDTLVQYRGNTTDIEPAVAEMWESSADGLKWTFHLRQGVEFHDGTPLNANAVVFSLTRPNALSRNFYEEFIDRITVLDDFTVQIALKTPYAPFLSTMASSENAIVSPAAVAHFGENFGDNLVGTGPFKFVQWDRNDQILLTANDTHWAGKPAIDKLIFRSIPDNADRLMELQQSNLHAMEFPNPDELAMIRGNARLELLMQPSLNVGYLAMNLEKPPFDNLKVRLAINHAINKTEIIERLYQGTGIPAKNPIPPTLWSYDEIEDYAYDPELAKQLLAEAGYPDGFETTLWALPIPRPYIPDGQALAEALQSDLRNIGIEAKIVTFDWQTYIEKTENGEHGYGNAWLECWRRS